MPILEDFCDAFEQAIKKYETQRGDAISPERQIQIENLRAYLFQCRNGVTNVLALREVMLKQIEDLPFEWTELFSGVRLGKALQLVLKEFRFCEKQLMFTQYFEMQCAHRAHEAQIQQKTQETYVLTQKVNYLMTKIDELTRRPDGFSAQEFFEKNGQLAEQLRQEQENSNYLKRQNEQLKESLKESKQLKVTHEKLRTEHQDLKEQYEALKAKHQTLLQETSLAHQSAKPTVSYAFT